MRDDIQTFGDAAELARGAAEAVVSILSEAVRQRGNGSFALSGGSTPRAVYECLATSEFSSRVPWEAVHLFWGDERCVPPYMPESNYRMANEALIKHLPIPHGNVHRIPGEMSPVEAAGNYEQELIRYFDTKLGDFPSFDVLLLGLGHDGHMASLFPETDALHERVRFVRDLYVEAVMAYRVTLTLPVINNAANILFLVAGASKAEVLKEVVEEKAPGYPASTVRPDRGRLMWFVDREAASELRKAEQT